MKISIYTLGVFLALWPNLVYADAPREKNIVVEMESCVEKQVKFIYDDINEVQAIYRYSPEYKYEGLTLTVKDLNSNFFLEKNDVVETKNQVNTPISKFIRFVFNNENYYLNFIKEDGFESFVKSKNKLNIDFILILKNKENICGIKKCFNLTSLFLSRV